MLFKYIVKGVLLLGVVTLLYYNAVAQKGYGDGELWTGIELVYRVNKQLTIDLEEELRLNENMSQFKTAFTEFGIGYKLHENLRTKFKYRFGLWDDNVIGQRKHHRLTFELTPRYKFKMLIFTYRFRYQREYSELYSDENRRLPETYLRQRLLIRFDLDKKISPFTGYETYSSLNKSTMFELHTRRIYFGANMKINKYNDISLRYIYERNLYNLSDLINGHILSINYALVLNKFFDMKNKKDFSKDKQG